MTPDRTTADATAHFRIDQGSGLPPYLQLVRQVREALCLGLLRSGDQLPGVKEFATRLAINQNTVLKAYRELAGIFAPLAERLAADEETIVGELNGVQGQPVELGGYYHVDKEKADAVMRPSATLNAAISQF